MKSNKKLINIQEEKTIKPAFETCIPIVFSSSNYFAPYLGVTIQSIIDCSTPHNNYDLIVFTSDMSENNQNILCQMVSKNTNFSIRFVDVAEIFSDLKLYTALYWSVSSYFKLIAPLFMKDYQKILVLDSDLCILEDVAHLYNIDILDYSIGACEEHLVVGLVEVYGQQKKDYIKEIIGLENIEKYFNTGVMLINISKFIEHDFSNILLDMVSTFNYHALEQDALNKLFKEDVCRISCEWNYLTYQSCLKERKLLENMSDYARKNYLAVTQPKILHFAGPDKPWFCPNEEWATTWWKSARKTPFYELILANMTNYKIKKNSEHLYNYITMVGNYKYNILNYWRCKILRNLTFGKKRTYYIQKKEILKENIRQAQEVLKK